MRRLLMAITQNRPFGGEKRQEQQKQDFLDIYMD